MIHISAETAEAELRSCVQEQSAVFEQAVMLIERLEAAASKRELGTPDSVAQLQKSLDRVVNAQQQVSAAHGRFTNSRASLTGDLRRTLARHEELLKTLIVRIDELQETFESVRNDLKPMLDTESRRKTMQAAYQQSMRQV